MITNSFLIPALFKFQEKNQLCIEYERKIIEMTDRVKDLEAKVVDNIVKSTKIAKTSRQSKIKTQKTQKNTVPPQ